MKTGVRCLALLLAAVTVPTLAWSKSVEFTFNEVVVSIDTPPDIEVQNLPSAHDFLLYEITSRGARLGGVYVGNHPQDRDIPKEKLRKSVIAGCRAYSFERRESGGLSRDVFVMLAPPSGAPQVVHFFYRNLAAEQARQVDGIVMSLKPLRGGGCRG